MQPLFSMRAGGLAWIGAFHVFAFVASVAAVLAWFLIDDVSIWVIASVFVSTSLLGAFIDLIVPRRFEVYDDRLRLCFRFYGWDLSFETIERVGPAGWWMAYGYWGIRFATAPNQAVEVRRRSANLIGRPNLIISPEDRETFLMYLQPALSRYALNHRSDT